ncbi:MAG: fused MFS/spermidine synthase [Myxococcales bacterium]|nr:fused MFS/spermidine synthase [Myxococcales bacterium]
MGILWIAFFLSGIAGLAYELTWVRYLHQLLGASTAAVSATISIFFAGMALGAIWGGRIFDRSRDPLRTYANLELLIGLSAACVPFLFQGAESILHFLPTSHEHPLLLLVLSAAILCVPATLIGAVFPAMAAVVRYLRNPTHATGYFYGFNTLGAVVGCFVVSFWWLPLVGQAVTTWTMALLNLAVALWLRTLRLPTEPTQLVSKVSEPTPEKASQAAAPGLQHPRFQTHSPESSQLPKKLFLALATTSGLLSISLEVLWTRSLSLVLPTSIAEFGLVMSAYLLGVGTGSLWIGRRAQKRPPSSQTLWKTYAWIAVFSLLPLLFFPNIPQWRDALLGLWGGFSWGGALFLDNFFAFVLMFPVTFLMGIALPILIGLATQDRQHTGRTAGRLYAVNTCGSIVGSLAVAFWWMPTWGIAESLWLIAIVYAVMAFSILFFTPTASIWPRLTLISSLGLAILVWHQDRCPQINPAKRQTDRRFLFYKDATALTVAVYEQKKSTSRDPQPKHRSLAINNDDDTTSTHPRDLQRQYLLGHLPYFLHPAPKDALLFGLSNGTTLAALTRHRLRSIQCIENHRLLSHVTPLFQKENLAAWKDPRVQLLYSKKLRFLQRTADRYDLIIDDLFRPSARLETIRFTTRYLEAIKKRLKHQGIYVSWLPFQRLSPQALAVIYQSFLQTFPNTQLFVGDWNREAPLVALVSSLRAPLRSKEIKRRINQYIERSSLLHSGTGSNVTHTAATLLHQQSLVVLKGLDDASFRPLLSRRQLSRWAQDAQQKHGDPALRLEVLRGLLHIQKQKNILVEKNLNKLEALQALQGTPWSNKHAFRQTSPNNEPLAPLPQRDTLHNTTVVGMQQR